MKLQLLHYACKPLRTLVAMGDINTDKYAEHRKGKDMDSFLGMMGELRLVCCARVAWSRVHANFVTHGGDCVHADSHIDYILVISEASATAVRRLAFTPIQTYAKIVVAGMLHCLSTSMW